VGTSNGDHAEGRHQIDWMEVRRRVDAAAEAIAEGARPTPVITRRILRERSELLAVNKMSESTPGEYLDVILFQLAGERYGIESFFVREVHALRDLTPLPGTPPFILGIVNARGRIVSLVDLCRLLDMPEHGPTELDRIIVIGDDTMEMGLLAHEVFGASRVDTSTLQVSLPTLTGFRQQLLRGMTPERTVIIDGGCLLHDERILDNDGL